MQQFRHPLLPSSHPSRVRLGSSFGSLMLSLSLLMSFTTSGEAARRRGEEEVATSQDPGIMNSVQGILGDINGRLFNLRAGWGEEPQDTISDSLSGGVDEGVIDGQGDGPETPIAKTIPKSRQWEVFSTVNYANVNINGIQSQAGVNSQTWAPGVGLERHFTRRLTLGFAANLLESHQTYSNNLGSLSMQGVALSAYGSYVRRSFWTDLLYSWGTFDLDTKRNPVGFPQALGNFNAMTNALQLNSGWSFRVPAWKLVHGPLVGLDWLHINTSGYNEAGGGGAALSYASHSVDSLITRVGWSASTEFDTSFAKITPQLRLTYERQNINNNNGVSTSLPVTITNQSPGQSYMVAGAGVNFEFTRDFSMLLTYQGQYLRENMQAHYGTVRFSYKF
ncbi:autotransporter outer membrane beta-barrel domain-containing protein [Prosthecobacter sp.]|uniref:autotransporter outer membrane beta-barrel domain-containing protein n=1 Tax=Prosthecobacter sp. TaxID=1965333 RepID=UPI00378344C8